MLSDLDESCNSAMIMFLNMEQRLERNVTLKGAYIEFVRTYAELSHMEEIKETNIKSTWIYYLSRYAVKKTDPRKYEWYLMPSSAHEFSLNDVLLPDFKRSLTCVDTLENVLLCILHRYCEDVPADLNA